MLITLIKMADIAFKSSLFCRLLVFIAFWGQL